MKYSQWSYLRELLTDALSADPVQLAKFLQYIQCNEEIYIKVGKDRQDEGIGEINNYRSFVYNVDYNQCKWSVQSEKK